VPEEGLWNTFNLGVANCLVVPAKDQAGYRLRFSEGWVVRALAPGARLCGPERRRPGGRPAEQLKPPSGLGEVRMMEGC